MVKIMRFGRLIAASLVFLGAIAGAAMAAPAALQETPSLAPLVAQGKLPPVAQRVPTEPAVADITAPGRKAGRPGGTLRTLMSKEKDIRLVSTWSYARLVGWTPSLALQPDLLKSVDVKDGRIFTFRIRAGHRWSDGVKFTSEDFRYFWEDIANNAELSPKGPPSDILNDGEVPKVEIIDELTVRYTWSKPNARFLPVLAQAREPYIYRPAHYLKQFHAGHAPKAQLDALVSKRKMRSWAQLHNQMDSMGNNDNPAHAAGLGAGHRSSCDPRHLQAQSVLSPHRCQWRAASLYRHDRSIDCRRRACCREDCGGGQRPAGAGAVVRRRLGAEGQRGKGTICPSNLAHRQGIALRALPEPECK
jgi:ABC-type transport system substrate-binding protein